MGWTFRKSMLLGKGIRLNIGKRGLGISAGVKGFRVGVGSKGTYTSVGIPGTGLYSVNYSKNSNVSTGKSAALSKGCLSLVLVILVLSLLISVPPVGFPLVIIGGTVYYLWLKKPKQQANQKLQKARKFFNQQNYEEAINLLTEAHELDNSNYDVIRLLGASLHNSEKFDESIRYLEIFLEKYPLEADLRLNLANCLYRTGKYGDAIGILQKLPEDCDQNLKVIQLIGACFAAEKKYDLAINVFKKAPLLKHNLDKDLMEVHYNLAILYEESGDKMNALKHFKKVYAQDSEYRDVTKKMEALDK